MCLNKNCVVAIKMNLTKESKRKVLSGVGNKHFVHASCFVSVGLNTNKYIAKYINYNYSRISLDLLKESNAASFF